MSEIFKKLDKNFNHVLIHTGQHYEKLLSGSFFEELKIREPDYNLSIGGPDKEHFHQTALVSVKLIELFRSEKITPDIILFLGDSNSVCSALPLRKEGYTIGHIEAGMRSGDKRMLEEINRTVCDHCSNYHFVYHKDYGTNLTKEKLPKENIFVVGNTIVEPCNKIKPHIIEHRKHKQNYPEWYEQHILLDIHRPENFKYQERLSNILLYANQCMNRSELPVYMLGFKRTMDYIKKFNLDTFGLQVVDIMPYEKYMKKLAQSFFIISDSGTAQEEPAIFGIPVIVPRDYTERPQSMEHNCSYMLDVNSSFNQSWRGSFGWLDNESRPDASWLGGGETSDNIIDSLNIIFNNE